MPTHLKQFAYDLQQEIHNKAADDTNPRLREDIFTEHVLELLSEHNETDGWTVCYYRANSLGSIPGAKLNAWSLSGDGATLDLFVSLHHDTGAVEEVGKADAVKFFKLLRGFLRRALDGLHVEIEESSDAFQAAQQIHHARESLTTVRLFFLTDGVVRSLKLDEEPFKELEVRYVVWDLDKLSRLRVGVREVIELDFVNNYGGAVPCLQTADATGEYRTFLAYLPAPLLARIYGEHGQRLLERNVRAFLQAKGKVNRGLQKTLKEEPHRFLAYNNGLCCTAAEVKVQAGNDGHARLEWVSDFQIVNGGQTTASIYHALKRERVDVSQVMVQVKLTVLNDPSEVPEIVPLISRFANSQNKVKETDLSANGPFHRAIELISRRTWAPAAGGLQRGTQWYYERASGSYLDDKSRQKTPARRREWENQIPSNQKFTKTDVAKFEHVWRSLPHFVCLGAEKNFKIFADRMADVGEPVVDEAYFRHLVAKAILYRTAERLFTSLGLQGYRANSVAYALAWLSHASGQRIDLERIWREQRLSPLLSETIRMICSEAHAFISQLGGNQGEASKKEECWKLFSDKKIVGLPNWEAELATTSFVPANSDEESMERAWEGMRHAFVTDQRTFGSMAIRLNVKWPYARYSHVVGDYAKLTWAQIKNKSGFGLAKQRAILELLKRVGEESA